MPTRWAASRMVEPAGDFVGHVIDLDMYGFHSLSLPLLTFADRAEFALLDAGAALNALGGIDGMRLATVPLIAPAGQVRAHSVQPLHLSGSIL